MGRRGTKARPIEQLRVIGSQSVYKRKDEPESVAGRPEPPEWLSDGARAQWEIMVARIEAMQFSSPAWREALAQFCEAWAEWEELVVKCRGAEPVVYSEKGSPYLNPLLNARNMAFDRVTKIGKEFGYTPASKASIKVDAKPAQKASKPKLITDAS